VDLRLLPPVKFSDVRLDCDRAWDLVLEAVLLDAVAVSSDFPVGAPDAVTDCLGVIPFSMRVGDVISSM
jgi:hypothetical protein